MPLQGLWIFCAMSDEWGGRSHVRRPKDIVVVTAALLFSRHGLVKRVGDGSCLDHRPLWQITIK